jgi:hypothetical protein
LPASKNWPALFQAHYTAERTKKQNYKIQSKALQITHYGKTPQMPLRTLQRGKDKPRLTRDQKRAARRVGDLSRIYRDQYPHGLPHNSVGINYAKYICRTMAFLPKDRRAHWLDRYASWMDPEVRGGILDLGPYWYSPRSLGNRLEIDDEGRERLKAWTTEACDISKEEREVINREKNRQSHERGRRKNGAKARGQSLSRMQPWKLLDMSRAKFYRLSKEARAALVTELARRSSETDSSRPSLVIRRKDETVSPSKLPVAAIPAAPSQPKGPTLSGGEIPAVPQQEPSKPTAPVVSLAEYLARRKAAAIEGRSHPSPTPVLTELAVAA